MKGHMIDNSTIAAAVAVYTVGINVLTFVLFKIDKSRAAAGQWRISEATLLLAVLLGGSVGGQARLTPFPA
jgi:uncharacterized membrane protein YsdA (DUF1294 family)